MKEQWEKLRATLGLQSLYWNSEQAIAKVKSENRGKNIQAFPGSEEKDNQQPVGSLTSPVKSVGIKTDRKEIDAGCVDHSYKKQKGHHLLFLSFFINLQVWKEKWSYSLLGRMSKIHKFIKNKIQTQRWYALFKQRQWLARLLADISRVSVQLWYKHKTEVRKSLSQNHENQECIETLDQEFSNCMYIFK